jgi:hypothetical protein
LVELPVALIVAALLVGVLLPAVQRLRDAAIDMERNRSLAPIGAEIRAMCDGSVRSAEAFLFALGGLAADPAQVPLLADGSVRADDLSAHYCSAASTYEALASELGEALETGQLPAVQRRLLRRTSRALDAALPAVQRVRDVLQVRGLCDPANGPAVPGR